MPGIGLWGKLNEIVNLFAALSALSYGIANFSGGTATRKSDVSAVMVWSQTVGILTGLLRRRPLRLRRGSRSAAAAAGIMDIAANLFFILAAGSGVLITPSIVVGLHPAPTVMLQRIIFREKLGRLRTAGVIAALAGIVLIGMD